MKSALASRRRARRRSTQGGKAARFRLTPLAVALGAAMGLPVAHGQQIVIDGRTATNLAVSGKVTNVTTATRFGNNAFNSFSKFDVNAGNTVNLHVPNGAANLLNLISSASASRIDGMLNAIKNGQIGGNVFLANPEGVIVGSSGVINVGSLTLLTPSHAFVDGFFDSPGMPSAGAVSQMLSGTVPINPNGLIRVQGKVNVTGDATLRGGNVDVDGVIQSGALFTNTQVDFSDVVNTTDIKAGSAVIVQNGKIRIVAMNDVVISGTVAANGGNGISAGAIDIRAGHDLSLDAGTLITASGRGEQSAGGSIFAWADHNAATHRGVTVRADGGGISGNAGAIEVSAKKRLTLGGGSYSAVAANGADGSLLFDPEDLVIEDDLLRGQAMAIPDGIAWDAGNLTLWADNTVTVAQNVVISTRQVDIDGGQSARDAHILNASTGDSGNVTITAHRITLQAGSQILAQATGSHAAGDITLSATDDATAVFFKTTDDQRATIDVHGATLKGRNITLTASADDLYEYVDDNDIANAILKEIDDRAYMFDASLSQAEARILIDGGATLTASADVKIATTANADASMSVTGKNGLGMGYGKSTSIAITEVANASIQAGGKVDITAEGTAATNISVDTLNREATTSIPIDTSKYIDFALAISDGSLDVKSSVGSQATIQAGDAVKVGASGHKNLNVTATGGAYDDGTTGAGVALSWFEADVYAEMLGRVSQATDVNVTATLDSSDVNNGIQAKSGSGTGALGKYKKDFAPSEILSAKIGEFQDVIVNALFGEKQQGAGTSGKLGLAASFLYLDQQNNVEATIGSQARVNASGNVNVTAFSEDVLSYYAASTVDKAKLDGATDPTLVKKYALSAAVAIVDLGNHTKASIGDNAWVDAGGDITVFAHSDVPVPYSLWGDWSSTEGWFDTVKRVENLVNTPTFSTITGWTRTTAESEKLGITGSFNFFTLDNTADAWIGKGARINTAGTLSGDRDVSISALASQGTINLAGVFGFKFFGSVSDSTGLGGAMMGSTFNGRATATVGRDTIIRADDVLVDAHTESNNIFIAEAGGKSANGGSFNASAALTDINNVTTAQVDRTAVISATGDVDIRATDVTRTVNVAGGVSKGVNAVGLAVAIGNVDRQTLAGIGQVGLAAVSAPLGLGGALDGGGGGLITLPNASTFAQGQALVYTRGSSATPAIVGLEDGEVYYVVIPNPNAPSTIQLSKTPGGAPIATLAASGGGGDSLSRTGATWSGDTIAASASSDGRLTSVAFAGSLVTGPQSENDPLKIDSKDAGDSLGKAGGAGTNQKGKYGIGLSGDASVSKVTGFTEASLDGARVTGADAVTISAADTTRMFSLAGAIAVVTGQGNDKKPGIAGSYAETDVAMNTRAMVTGSLVDTSGVLSVLADNDSFVESYAAGVAVSTKNAGLAGSVTLNSIGNRTRASIDAGSAVSAASVSIEATDTSAIQAAAGAVDYAGKGLGFGASVAVNDLRNEVLAYIEGSDVEATSGGVTVRQESIQDIDVVAATVGAGGDANIVSLSVAANFIENQEKAYIDGRFDQGVEASGEIRVTSIDRSDIDTIGGGVAISGQAGAGASGAYNIIQNTVSAGATDTRLHSTNGNVIVEADVTNTIESIGIGFSASKSGGLAASVAVNRIETSTEAFLDGADVVANGSVAVTADAEFDVRAIGGSLAITGSSLGFGGTVGINLLDGETRAWIAGASQVDAAGNSTVTIIGQDAGSTRVARGVAVAARTDQDVRNDLVSGAVSGSGSISLTGAGNEAAGETIAYIGEGSDINARHQGTAHAQQAVSVEASTDTKFSGLLGALSLSGSAAAGATAAVQLMSGTTRAYVDDAQVQSKDLLRVAAKSKESIDAAAAAASVGGDLALAGTVFVTRLNGVTEAYIRNTGGIDAGGDLIVRAEDAVTIGRGQTVNGLPDGLTGGAAAFGTGAAGGAVSLASIGNTTRAYMTDVEANATGATRVQAVASQELHSAVVGVVGAIAGASASVVVNNVSTRTEAFISETAGGGTVVNGDPSSAGASQDVEVSAANTTLLRTDIYSVSIGAAAVGASVEVATVRNGVSATIGAGVEVHAQRDVSVTADSQRDLGSRVVAFGGGATSAQGAVSVYSVGGGVSGDFGDAQGTSAGQVSLAQSEMGFEGEGSYLDDGDAFAGSVNPASFGTAASIGAGAQVGAGNDITVSAADRIEMHLEQGGAVIAGLGAGAAIGLIDLKPVVKAGIGNGAMLEAGGDVDIDASATLVASSNAYVAALGVGVVSAAVTMLDSEATVEAWIGDSASVEADSVSVNAARSNDQDAEAKGATVGLKGAVGASVAQSTSGGSTRAWVGSGADLATAGALSVTASNNAPASGGNHAYAAAAAVGGLLGASGAVAIARSEGDVEAYTAAGVKLPDGDVIVAAGRQSLQTAEAFGIAAGLLAIGLTDARAESSGSTKAVLGAGAVTEDDREGDLLVAAVATDTNLAESEAGSGGVIAGNGAFASTSDNSSVHAEIQAAAAAPALHGGAVRVQALHVSTYRGEANSINAALVGASGAEVRNNLTADATALIGAGVKIVAADIIAAGARNEFYSVVGGDSASGAAGGVLSGSAVQSHTNITSTTTTELGAGVDLDSGTDPMSRPGGILLDASTVILASDRVELTTGGAIAIADTASSIDARAGNNVKIGNGAELASQGNISAGTFTLANLKSEARTSTWGLAGVGFSYATTNATIDETVSVGAGAQITAFGNVNLMAGDDPSGIYDSSVSANADALSYVRGLIAVPESSADANISSDARLEIGGGAKVNSGQNVTIGAYNGLLNPVTNAEGHGFQLGFIPTENGNQGGGPSKIHTATVVNGGDVVAGYYHRLNIHIPACATGSVSCAVNADPGGAPFDWSYERFFNAPAFINANFGGAGAALIASGTSSTPVGAITLGTLFASGGNVTVNADTISGGGSITAHGAPTITVANESANYLVLGNVLIPNVPGGDVQFTGEAGETQAAAAGMAIHRETNQEGVITIHNAFDGAVGSSIYGPALFLMGDIENIGGKVLITNDRGSLGQAATIFGKEVQVKVPEGVAVIDIPNGTYYAGGNPYSEWQDFWFWPDDTPGNVMPGASAFFAGIFPGTNEQAPRNGATRYFISADCSGGDCYLTSVSPFRSYTFQSNSNNDANLDGSRRSSAIYGGKVLISAKYIDINGGITIGTDTDWSLNLAASLMDPVTNSYIGYPLNGGEIARADWLYANKLVSNPIFDLQTVTADAGDSRIGVKYDAQNKRILLDNVKASSDGGSLVLDGRILSTNGLGNIHVNGGLGDVDIDNQTGLAVVVRDVYAGNPGSRQSVVSTVDITDRNYADTSNHWVYNYTPQDGLAVYNGALNSSLDDGNMTLVSSGGSSSRLYQPLSGLRWMWEQVAFMNIAPPIVPPGTNTSLENWGNYLNVGPWSWEMPAGQPNNPWQYVAWNDNGTRTGALSTTPTGTLVAGGAGQPVFSRTFSAQVTESWGFWTNTSGSQNFWFDNANPHTLFYPEQVKYTVTSSLKADNPIAIDFSGSAQSRVAINSKGNVSLTGTITNPGGPTTIAAVGSVTQAAGASIQTDSLVISATAGIGSSLQPIVSRLAPEGLVKAAGGAEGIFLALTGGRIQEVVAKKAGVEQYGDVVISALDDLVMESGGAGAIIGANVTLSSLLGSVGTGADPIRMSAMGASGQSGVVNVSAREDIHLHDSAAHDFLVGEIASTIGDISIEAPNGSIMNASEQTSAQALSEDQVQQVWKDLKLIRGAGADGAEERGSAAAHSVVAFQNMIESQHAQYWDMIGDGTVVDGKFVLKSDAATVAKYSERAAAAGTTVQQFAEDRYAGLAGSFSENVGADWQTRAAFVQAPAEGDPAFRFVASQAQIDALTRESGWTAEELNYSVSEVALQSRSAPVGSGQPNIIGHDIRLVAGGSIGRLAEPVDITLDQVADGTLNATQKAALALAKAPGDIVRLGKDADGNFVTYQLARKPNGDTDYDSIPAGVTAYGFRIAQTSPLFLEMTGALNAEAGDALFVQAVLPTLTIDRVKAGGTAGLVAIENIVAATLRTHSGSALIETGADLRLTAGSGSLGATGAALALQVGGKLVSASAGQDAFLTGEGSLTFDRVVAGNQVVLKANGGSLLAGAEGVAINARGISLEAGGDIGSAQSPVIVQIDGPGSLSATAGGSATVQGMGASFNVSTFEAGADASLAASGHLEAASVTGGGAVALAAGGNLHATQVSSGAVAHAEATGDIAIETLESGGGAGFVAGGTVQSDIITSGGDTTIDAAGNVAVGTLDSGGAVGFVSGGTVQADAVTSAGNAAMDAAGSVAVGALDSGGAIDFQSGGDMGIGTMTAAGAARLTSQGFLLSTAAPGGVNVTAANITLMSNGADIGAASKYFVIEDLGTTNATAFRDIYLEQRNRSLNAELLASADGSVNVLVGTGDATIAKIAAPAAVNVRLASSGTLHIADLDPTTANLAVDGAGGAIDVDSALIARSLTASASTITLDSVQQVGGSGPLHLVLQGAGGGIANGIDANIISANDVTIDRLAARNALIDANVSNLWIENGRIVSFGRFSNEAFTATIDNFNHVRYDSDLQLFAPGQFYLRFFADARFETNALAIDYGDGFTVNGMGSGNSVTRFIPRLLTLVGLSRDSGKVDEETPETGLVTWSSSALIPDDAITAIEQLEVNRR